MENDVNQQLVGTLLRRIERLEEENENLRRQLVTLLSLRVHESPGPWRPEVPILPPVKTPFVKTPFYYGAGDFPSPPASEKWKDRSSRLDIRL